MTICAGFKSRGSATPSPAVLQKMLSLLYSQSIKGHKAAPDWEHSKSHNQHKRMERSMGYVITLLANTSGIERWDATAGIKESNLYD